MDNSFCRTALRVQASDRPSEGKIVLGSPAEEAHLQLFGEAVNAMKTTQTWRSYRTPNFGGFVGSKFIFLQCKKPFPHALRSGERLMLPMVAVRKLGEGCQ